MLYTRRHGRRIRAWGMPADGKPGTKEPRSSSSRSTPPGPLLLPPDSVRGGGGGLEIQLNVVVALIYTSHGSLGEPGPKIS